MVTKIELTNERNALKSWNSRLKNTKKKLEKKLEIANDKIKLMENKPKARKIIPHKLRIFIKDNFPGMKI